MLKHMKTKLFCVLLLNLSLPLFGAPPDAATAQAVPEALKFDAESKQYLAKTGDTSAAFDFIATNVSKDAVSIHTLKTSCGCTVAQLPSTPYKLQPGSNVALNVSMSLVGKYGLITKSVTVESSAGSKTLLVSANIPTENKTETK